MMSQFNRASVVLLLLPLLMLMTTTVRAGWGDVVDIFKDNKDKITAVPGASSALSNSEIIEGLKAALSKGTKTAVSSLGQQDGYFKNPDVKIPMPGALQKVESALRTVGKNEYADEFVLTMNRAAEQAVPEAASIFSESIKEMSIADAKEILNGSDDAATQYFKRTSSGELIEKMRPIVAAATDSVGVTSSYKGMVDKLGFAGQVIDTDSLDIDQYVTDKAVAGLFTMIAAEEKKIRQDPVARTSDILKKVFQK